MVSRITRSTRVIMLLTSYLDARPGLLSSGSDYVRTSKPGSSMPRLGGLWEKGSYQELLEALDEIPASSKHRLWTAYIYQPDRKRRAAQTIFRQKGAKDLVKDVEEVSKKMPRRIRVPSEIIQNYRDYVDTDSKRLTDQSLYRADGWVYFVQNGEGGPIKIGSASDPHKRVYALQTASADRLVLLGLIKNRWREKQLQSMFRADHIRGEWFRPSKELLAFIDSETNMYEPGDLVISDR